MMQTVQQAEASRYLRQRPALLALARAFCENYCRLGHFGGTYRVEAAAEPEALEAPDAELLEPPQPARVVTIMAATSARASFFFMFQFLHSRIWLLSADIRLRDALIILY